MGTNKLFNKPRPDKASCHVITGSLPLKKRKLRLNFIDHAQDSHVVTLDSSRHIVNSDSRTSLSTPKIALSSIVPQVSPIETCLPTLDPSSSISLADGGNPGVRINGTKKNLPRLVTPLPNGCHWQTVRDRSYCRRQPCYNGSNFCKLHYQHHNNVSKRQRSESSDQTADDTTSSVPLKTATEGAPMLPNIMHQDKRFTEAPGQVRCLATTTRGRPCAYVSVNGTKYCNLHSQYETSRPAPRRNSHTITMNLAPKSSSKSPLCSMPTVSWLNQTVTISVGPLRDSTGTVEKWGNGWVSVRVPGVGLHNRRSFELFITPPKQDDVSIPSSQGRQITDSSSSDDASHASSNRSIAKSPIPTLILAAKSVLPQHIVSPHSA